MCVKFNPSSVIAYIDKTGDPLQLLWSVCFRRSRNPALENQYGYLNYYVILIQLNIFSAFLYTIRRIQPAIKQHPHLFTILVLMSGLHELLS